MRKLAVFLRGINVNGVHIKVDELKEVVEAAEYTEVSLFTIYI